jgi:hypothetical protein
MTTEEMVARGHSHTALRAELARQGLLHRHERELLLEAADALLFDEPEAQTRTAAALELLETLVAAGRRTTEEADRLRDALAGCGVAALTTA